MKQRQKILLALFQAAETEITRTQLVKWCFLIRMETDVRERLTFYDFLPYRFGPYSFLLQREFSQLMTWGYIEENGAVKLTSSLKSEVEDITAALSQSVLGSVHRIVSRYSDYSHHMLIDAVYNRYPWYSTRSELRRPVHRNLPSPERRVYTVGYEGESVDCFFNRLISEGIERIIDVRRVPFSRKYGFSKRSLDMISRKLNIEYLHLPNLGIDTTLRREITTEDDRILLLEYYRTDLLSQVVEDVAYLSKELSKKPSALLCFEADPQCCHRSVLANRISIDTGMEVEHL
jgi:uncharacterized protein (DUF488 family)